MIQITADTRRAVVTNKELLTKGSAGIQVRFTLSEDWAGLAKVAVFRQGDDGERVDCVLDSGLTCVVPSEVLTIEDEVVFCGVYGSNGQGSIIIPTIWASLGVVRPGTEPNTPATATPTPEIWAQILNVAQDAEATADEAMSFVEAGLTDLSALEAMVETAEASRVLAEQGRVSAENQRVMAENNRVSAENARVAEENERNAAETARAGAERNRTTAENARADAEASRASAEQERVAAEQYREEKYAEYVQTVTDAADDARASATTAANSASTATAAARDASDSAGQAATSASAAATSASQASSSESNASSSASTATGAAAAATTQAGVASTKADEAASSATAAAGSATDAAAAQTAAETAQAAAEDAADSVSASAAQIAQNASDIADLSRHLSDLEGSLATVETTSTASKAYVVDDLLVYNNQLYKVASVIAAGGTLTPGTNITATTVEGELDGKQDAPATAGVAGQILSLNDSLQPVWANPASPINEYLYSKFRTYSDGIVTAGQRRFIVRGHSVTAVGLGESTTYYQINITGSVLRIRSGAKNSFPVYDTDFIPCSMVAGRTASGSPFYAGIAIYLKRMMTQYPGINDAGDTYIFFKDSEGNVIRTLTGGGNYYNAIWNLTELCKSYSKFAIYVSKKTGATNSDFSILFELAYEPLIYNET